MSQRLEAEHWIAAPLPRVFAFFADPHNLPRIMPPSQGARLLKLNLVRPRFPAGETAPGAERMAGVGTFTGAFLAGAFFAGAFTAAFFTGAFLAGTFFAGAFFAAFFTSFFATFFAIKFSSSY